MGTSLTIGKDAFECDRQTSRKGGGGDAIWHFTTPERKVFSVCLPDGKAARKVAKTEIAGVRLVSLFWPMIELSEAVHSAKKEGEKSELVKGFLANLLACFGWPMIGAAVEVPDGTPRADNAPLLVSNARTKEELIGVLARARENTGQAAKDERREIPADIVKDVLNMVLEIGANPTHAECERLLRRIEKRLSYPDKKAVEAVEAAQAALDNSPNDERESEAILRAREKLNNAYPTAGIEEIRKAQSERDRVWLSVASKVIDAPQAEFAAAQDELDAAQDELDVAVWKHGDLPAAKAVKAEQAALDRASVNNERVNANQALNKAQAELDKTSWLPLHYMQDGHLARLVKRLALRYDTITPAPRREIGTDAGRWFTPLNAGRVYGYLKDFGSKTLNYAAIVSVWPDTVTALPVKAVSEETNAESKQEKNKAPGVSGWAADKVTDFKKEKELRYKGTLYEFGGGKRWKIINLLCNSPDPEGWVTLPPELQPQGCFSGYNKNGNKRDSLRFKEAAIEPERKGRGNTKGRYRIRP